MKRKKNYFGYDFFFSTDRTTKQDLIYFKGQKKNQVFNIASKFQTK